MDNIHLSLNPSWNILSPLNLPWLPSSTQSYPRSSLLPIPVVLVLHMSRIQPNLIWQVILSACYMSSIHLGAWDMSEENTKQNKITVIVRLIFHEGTNLINNVSREYWEVTCCKQKSKAGGGRLECWVVKVEGRGRVSIINRVINLGLIKNVK